MSTGRGTTHNVHDAVVEDFGAEWTEFDQSDLSDTERRSMFEWYFSIFPWHSLPANAVGFDAGCGTGRWALLVAPRVGHLHCVDPSLAIDVARRNLSHLGNCSFHRTTIDDMPIADGSMDFGYSLGVLHHVPDTPGGIAACARRLRSGAPFLVYLYYAFDNQPRWFRLLWRTSDLVRRLISRMPYRLKYVASQGIAAVLYWPAARMAGVLERAGANVHSFPLSAYRHRSFYTMRTDALDRFGTRLEQRFTKKQVEEMMRLAGFESIRFSDRAPFWCAVGTKR